MAKRIAVDIGNSRIACGLFEDTNLMAKWYHDLNQISEAEKEICRKYNKESVDCVAVSSVVPAAQNEVLQRLREGNIGLVEVSLANQKLISNTYPTLGVDRLANVAAVMKLYVREVAAAGIVIDFGTATTLTAVSSSGELLGGMITLGLKETLHAIYSSADQLPQLELGEKCRLENLNPLATTTEEAIINGTILAHIALVERWIQESKKRIDGETVVIATGGLSNFFSDALTGSVSGDRAAGKGGTNLVDRIDQDLTLKGINLIAAEVMVQEDPA